MKLNYDLNFIEKITSIENSQFKEKIKYFCNLPLNAQIEVLYQMKIIEEENENAFFAQNYNQYKLGEYRFGLFLLAIDRIKNFEQRAVKSKYSKAKIQKIKDLKNKGG